MSIPVIIGVGDVVNRSSDVHDAIEPLQLTLQAIEDAVRDTGTTADLHTKIDSIDVVACWTWPYDDLPDLLASKLGATPSHKFMPKTHGGNQPAKLLDNAARRIASGRSSIAVVCGGEALASLAACAKARKLPPPGWTRTQKEVDSVFSPTTRELAVGLGAPHSIGAPIHIYPLYENAFRAHRNQSIKANNDESARLYAGFSSIAEHHPYAWNYGKTADDKYTIGTVSKKNRMICFPYPLLMNAFNSVNLAAACILTSTARAKELGIPEERWVYPLGGAGTKDADAFWERTNYYTSPSIAQSLDAALRISGLTKDEIDLFDFYSCFPIVPKIACHHLGLSLEGPRPITLLGGLTSFGGAGNNYSMHALTEMVRQIRKGNARTGLVLANGGMMTYQHVICLSNRAGYRSYPENPLPDELDAEIPQVDTNPEGAAVIETYTVEFSRNGQPKLGHIVGRLKLNGRRFIANHGDNWTLQQLCSRTTEPVGRSGIVQKDLMTEQRNVFYLDKDSKL